MNGFAIAGLIAGLIVVIVGIVRFVSGMNPLDIDDSI